MIPLGDGIRRRHLPVATAALLVAELVAFAAMVRLPMTEQPTFVLRWALIPAALTPFLHGNLAGLPAVARLASSLFLHAGVLHLLGNLLFLLVFGRAVEAAMGAGRFLGFFLLCGVVAGVVHTLMSPGSTQPTVGASGAISGLLGAYLGLHPRAKVRSLLLLGVLPLFVEVPAALWLLAWLALQLLEGMRSLAAGPGGGAVGVAWFAHVGGFAAGLLLFQFFRAGGERRVRRRAGRPA